MQRIAVVKSGLRFITVDDTQFLVDEGVIVARCCGPTQGRSTPFGFASLRSG
jgi:hypothetical protein